MIHRLSSRSVKHCLHAERIKDVSEKLPMWHGERLSASSWNRFKTVVDRMQCWFVVHDGYFWRRLCLHLRDWAVLLLHFLTLEVRSNLVLSSHLLQGLPSGLFPSDFPTKTTYTPLISPIRSTCPAHLFLLDVDKYYQTPNQSNLGIYEFLSEVSHPHFVFDISYHF